MTEHTQAPELTLTSEELDLLIRFFRRAIDLHDRGAVSPESVIDYLRLVTDALDPQLPGSIAALGSALEDAWREADG